MKPQNVLPAILVALFVAVSAAFGGVGQIEGVVRQLLSSSTFRSEVGIPSAGTPRTSFTPTTTWLANVTTTGEYEVSNGYCTMSVKMAFTGATTSATLTLTTPPGITIDSTFESAITGGWGSDSGNVKGPFTAVGASSTTWIIYYSSNTAGVMAPVTQSAPFTIANGDQYQIHIRFKTG